MSTYTEFIKETFGKRWVLTQLNAALPHDVSVQGSYTTGNIGDRAIGEIILKELTSRGFQTEIFNKGQSWSNADRKILGGGGVIHDWYNTRDLKRRLSFLGKGDVILGVGAPGIQSEKARSLVQEKLPELSLITTRDQRSKRVIQSVCDVNVEVTACPAWLQIPSKTPSSGRTGINARPWFHLPPETLSYYFDYGKDINTEEAHSKYISNINRICGAVENPTFIPFTKEDEEFAHNHLDIDVQDYEFSVKETLHQVNQVDQMVTTRYHSLVFASLCRTPVLPISYAPKVTSLAERLDINSYSPHEDIPVKFQNPSNISKMQKEAKRNFELLEKVL